MGSATAEWARFFGGFACRRSERAGGWLASAAPFALEERVLSVFLGRAPAPAGQGWIGSWSPGIGDPTPVGWITVALYLAAAFQCFLLARGGKTRLVKREGLYWWILAVGLLLLGINKQLDLQSALTELGRMVARQQGFYESRRELQSAFILEVILVLGFGVLMLGWLVRRAPVPTRAAIVGALLLSAFIAIRAASFHHFDLFINHTFLGLRANWILEIGGILAVMIPARWRMRYVGREPSRAARQR